MTTDFDDRYFFRCMYLAHEYFTSSQLKVFFKNFNNQIPFIFNINRIYFSGLQWNVISFLNDWVWNDEVLTIYHLSSITFWIAEKINFSMKWRANLLWITMTMLLSLFHMKITANVTKSSHEDRGPCYLHLQIFFL